MDKYNSVSTGMSGFDNAIDMLRLGDNVVWQVDSIDDYIYVVNPYIEQARKDNRNLVYIRFGHHKPVINNLDKIKIYEVDASLGFEDFATSINHIITKEGIKTFYVFDCLTDLLDFWYSDLMIANFFKVTCPYLYELDTIAYFAIKRNVHTYDTIAEIRETTQLLLDIYNIDNKYYIHPLKVWQRYSPTMFFPHYIDGDNSISITSSYHAAALFSAFNLNGEKLDYWQVTINKAKEALKENEIIQEQMKEVLINLLVGSNSRMYDMCKKYFNLYDIVNIASREIGTGFIGGKSVGMLLSRRILTSSENTKDYFEKILEAHDSFYIGSDVFYTYIVENGLWQLRTKQKTEEGYFKYAPSIKEGILKGHFTRRIKDEFIHMLEYFGQSPIIVRSSSLLEDNFGNAFAGKYDSVFCVNQGTPEERIKAFEEAVKIVYASTMNEDALKYRKNRGLDQKDEQMAILVQRVSGDYYGEYFFPHIAGVGNSSNLYVWDKDVDMEAGMLRLVFGLGTRAVDRVIGDYVKIVTLDKPMRIPLMNYNDEKKYTQHKVDVLNLKENKLDSISVNEAIKNNLKTNKSLFGEKDYDIERTLRDMGRYNVDIPYIINFKKLLKDTDFPKVMKEILKVLSQKYNYPIDIEFTANFTPEGDFKVNLLQCRPLQTRGLGKSIEMPKLKDKNKCLFYSKGNFMGGNVNLPIDYIVFIDVYEYLKLSEQNKYLIARQVGIINEILKDKNAMLMGPGRWGTTTPSLGVPVNFTELCNMSVVCEIAYSKEGLMPEISYGSHFFQDLVEGGIFYIALFDEKEDVTFNEDVLLNYKNVTCKICEDKPINKDIIKIYETCGMEVYSDILSQTVFSY